MMKFKITMLAALAVAMFPFAAQAQDSNSYDSLKVSCESGAECSDFGVNFQEQGDTVAQTRRTRTRRTRRSSLDSKYYVGGTIGLYLAGDPGNTGFGGSAKFGYNFSENFAAEAEGFGFFGGFDTPDSVDLNYNVLGGLVNGVGKYPFNADNDRSIYGFAGAGLGVGRVGVGGDDAPDDASETGFLFQVKGGLGYPVSEKLDIIGQLRYISITNDGDTGDDLTVDAGINFNL